jgi:hypothetical protein
MAARRRAWFDQLAEVLHEEGAGGVWDRLYDDLLADGKHWREAVPLAVRRARLAVYLLAGVEQSAAAARLGVSERTGKYDALAIRRVVLRPRGRSVVSALPRVPLTPDDVPAERRMSRR